MNMRLAGVQDIDQLIRMRWDFSNEYNEQKIAEKLYEDFYKECRSFLLEAMKGGEWFIWVADLDGSVISHIYLELIHKVPRPGRKTNPFVYMTNVYTVPEHRGNQIGSRMMKEIEAWSKQQEHEFIIVWPSEWSVRFYERNGYSLCNDPMELHL